MPISRRLGLTGLIVAAFVLSGVALLLRPGTEVFWLFVALSVLALMGPALGNAGAGVDQAARRTPHRGAG